MQVNHKATILDIAQKYTFTHLYLFGSARTLDDTYNDIDLAVEGLPAVDYFRFYGELLLALNIPVDLVDMSLNTQFTKLIYSESEILA